MTSANRYIQRLVYLGKESAIRWFPISYWRLGERLHSVEAETCLLPALCSTTGISIDVGANFGMYWEL